MFPGPHAPGPSLPGPTAPGPALPGPWTEAEIGDGDPAAGRAGELLVAFLQPDRAQASAMLRHVAEQTRSLEQGIWRPDRLGQRSLPGRSRAGGTGSPARGIFSKACATPLRVLTDPPSADRSHSPCLKTYRGRPT